MDEAASGLGGWLGDAGTANVLALLSLAATVGFGLLSCLFFYVPYLEGQLRTNPAFRHLKAKQLAQPRWAGLYRGWLVSTLNRLDRWMGRPGDWRRGFDWCLKAGVVYGYGFVLLAWVLGAPATLGELTILPDPARVSPAVRLLTAALLVGATSLGYLAARYGDRADARIDAWLAARLPATMSGERRQRAAGWVRRSMIAALERLMLC